MSIERVKSYFEPFGIEDRILEFNVSSATVELAAKALGCEPARIAKSLAFRSRDRYLLIVTAGNARIDNAKYRAKFKTKARMLSPTEAEVHIGHSIGGICPFGVRERVAVFLDVSLRKYETVYPACGSSNSAIELTIPELEKYSNNREWVDVCKIAE